MKEIDIIIINGVTFISQRRLILIKFITNYNKEAGISIVEVMVAVVIIGLFIPCVINIFFTTTRANIESREKQQALNLAEGIVEELRAVDVSNLKEVANQISSNDYPGIELNDYPGVQRVKVDVEGDMDRPNLIRVVVRVYWGSRDNTDIVELGTLILDHESI